MKFEWSDEKNNLNIKKHQVSFEEAEEVFCDPMHILTEGEMRGMV